MAQDDRAALTIWRRPRVQTETGYSQFNDLHPHCPGAVAEAGALGRARRGLARWRSGGAKRCTDRWPARRGTTRLGGTSRSPPPDGIQWSVVRAWLCNAPGLDGTLCIDSPRCLAATRCPRSHSLYGGPRHTGRCAETGRRAGRRAAGRTHSRAMPDDERWHEARRTRAMAGGDRPGAAAPSRPGRRRDRRSPPVAPAALHDEGCLAPWAWRPPSRARQMADAVSSIARGRTGPPVRRQYGSGVTRDR